MSDRIIDLQAFLQTPQGRYLLAWESDQLNDAVADIFGFHALQLGLPELHTLDANRMPHRWVAQSSLVTGPKPAAASAAGLARASGQAPALDLLCDFANLPFPANSLDLVVLPHTLELDADPHATLREVERVLVPEGRVVICGINPVSLWGLRQRRAHLYKRLGFGQLYLPQEGEFIGYWRLRDWLRLLSFEVQTGRFGCYRPAVRTDRWLDRFQWMDRVGVRWWPIFGAVYFIVAVKRVRGMRLVGPAWKAAAARGQVPVSLARRQPSSSQPMKRERP